jgi:hypothetical protein
MLRNNVAASQDDWDDKLPAVEFAINNAEHDTTTDCRTTIHPTQRTHQENKHVITTICLGRGDKLLFRIVDLPGNRSGSLLSLMDDVLRPM